MMRTKRTRRIVSIAVFVSGSAVLAQPITFETLPDGSTPVDNMQLPLGAAYTVAVDGGTVDVTIGFDLDGDGIAETPAVFEAVGNDVITGFSGFGNDTALPQFAQQLGSWFLRSQSALGDPSPVGVLVAQYSAPVQGLGGEVWDVDGPELWEIRGYRAGETLPFATVTSPPGGLDAAPWVFSLSDPDVGFTRLEIEHVGTRPKDQLGLAFNNFSASESIPGPTILNTQPMDVVRNVAGVDEVTVYWSVPVVFDENDVAVVTADVMALPVPVSVTGSGTQATTITFTGLPGGMGGGANDPLLNGSYNVTIAGLARALVDNVPIDGDNDGIAGGAAVFTVGHRCRADLAEPMGVLDLSDITAFIASFVDECD